MWVPGNTAFQVSQGTSCNAGHRRNWSPKSSRMGWDVNPGNKGGRYDDNDGGKAQANCGKLILYDREVNKKVNNIR